MPPATDVDVHVRTALAEVRSRLAAAPAGEPREAILHLARGAVTDELLDLLDLLGRQDDVIRFARVHPVATRIEKLAHLFRVERESLRHESDATGAADHFHYCEGILAGFEAAAAV